MKKAASHPVLVRGLLHEPLARTDRMTLFLAATLICSVTAVVGACLSF